jgi:trehalose 6-phosphate phosphatase
MADRPSAKPPARPRHLPAAWPDIVRAAGPAVRLALFIDFDGTLTRIQRSHSTVRLSARVRRVLGSLVASGHLVGIVSGRTLADIEARVGVRRAWYVGDQGFLLKAPTSHTVVLASAAQRARIARVAGALRARLDGTRGISIEAKVATLTVHYRGASRASRMKARRVVLDLVGGASGLRLMPGKRVWEVLPAAPVGKARAVSFILRLARAVAPGTRWLPIYIGDDIADEQVFKGWRGVSVAVGRRHHTAARYYVWSPAEVRTALESLADTYT